jgi:hypothetical protein
MTIVSCVQRAEIGVGATLVVARMNRSRGATREFPRVPLDAHLNAISPAPIPFAKIFAARQVIEGWQYGGHGEDDIRAQEFRGPASQSR